MEFQHKLFNSLHDCADGIIAKLDKDHTARHSITKDLEQITKRWDNLVIQTLSLSKKLSKIEESGNEKRELKKSPRSSAERSKQESAASPIHQVRLTIPRLIFF